MCCQQILKINTWAISSRGRRGYISKWGGNCSVKLQVGNHIFKMTIWKCFHLILSCKNYQNNTLKNLNFLTCFMISQNEEFQQDWIRLWNIKIQHLIHSQKWFIDPQERDLFAKLAQHNSQRYLFQPLKPRIKLNQLFKLLYL